MVVATVELRRITKAVFSGAKELLFPKGPFLAGGDFCAAPEDYFLVYGKDEKHEPGINDGKISLGEGR